MWKAWKIADFAGTTFRVHFTFWLLLAWVAFSGLSRSGSLAVTGQEIAFLLSIFGCVLLHELGHSLAARRYGIRTRDITLLPIGGVARLERMPDKPRQELVVALAGPAVNFAIVLLFAANRLVLAAFSGGEATLLSDPGFAGRLALVNLWLGVFNLLPAFPMDGGRVLRALLATRIGFLSATRWATTIGRGLAVVFVLTGIFFQPFLALIGIFVWFGAGTEWNVTRLQHGFRGVPVRSVMDTNYVALRPSQTLEEASAEILSSPGEDFPVVEAGAVVGLVTEEDLRFGLDRLGPQARVADVMHRRFVTAQGSEPVDRVIPRMMESSRPTLVLHGHRLAGLVTPPRLARILRFSTPG